MNWIRATELENWADTLDSKSRFPQLVRRLLHATVEDLRLIEFPAGEGVQREGWDGIVEATTGNAFVPSGISVWEAGTDIHISTKANKDFGKRKDNSLGVDQKQATYIFVTPRKWAKKADWREEKSKLGIWKDVRVYDSANFEEWLETAPSVDAWLAYLLGKRPTGITDIETHWANLGSLSTPVLSPAVFLAGRGDEAEFLKSWLGNRAGAIAYESRSPQDVIDFVAAYVASLDTTVGDSQGSRIAIVEEKEAWNILSSSRNRLVLIARPSLPIDSEMVAHAVRQGHQVLLCSHRFSNEHTNARNLPRPHRYEVRKTLVDAGFDEARADKLARESHGSLTVLKRLVCSLPSSSRPAWSHPSKALELVPILLAGAWDDALETDRNALATLAGVPYEKVLATANRWLASEDSPVLRVGSGWSLVSREDSWALLAPFITRQDLDNFERVAVEVLGEGDPRVGMDSKDRMLADLRGNTLRFSGLLRNGLAESLALLGAKAGSVTIPDSIGPERRASRVVNRLLPRGADWRHWASLSYHLPLLAESAPDTFLDAVEADLRQSEPQLAQLFYHEGEPPFFSSPHTGLLWAIESLAWDATNFARTCLILARLDASDPGGKFVNRPAKSLTEIFLPWFPQATASAEQRIAVLDRIATKEPEVGWKLMLSLLPNAHSHSSMIHSPQWRDWSADWTEGTTHAAYWQQVNAIVDRVLASAGNDVSRWEQLISQFESFPLESQARLLVGLRAFEQSLSDANGRSRIAKTLREKVHRHREFPDADWALPTADVDELEKALNLFEPVDLVARHAWLFDRFPRIASELSWKVRNENIFMARKNAISEIFERGGVPMVFDLAKVVESPDSVGFVLGKLDILRDDAILLPSRLTSEDKADRLLAAGYVLGRFAEGEWDWVSALHPDAWPPDQVATLALHLPFGRETWEFIARSGEEPSRVFWSHAMDAGYNLSKQDLDYCISQYRSSGRAFQAIHAISVGMYENYEFDSSLLMDTLEDGLRPRDELTGENLAGTGHCIQRIFERLQSSPDVDRERLARLEWAYLPMFRFHGLSPVALHGLLEEDPTFFAEAISVVYRSRDEKDDTPEPSEDQRAKASTAFTLLRSLHSVPGRSKEGLVDVAALTKWIRTARELCEASGRLEVCDDTIGQMLAHSPSEPDGRWPCGAVRDVLENIDSEDLFSGFFTGIINKRGMYSKSLTEGGLQERQLAETFEGHAKSCDFQWPATAKVLRRVAKEYVSQAKWVDDQLELR